MARHAAVPVIFYSQQPALNIHGSVRKSKRAKHRCAPAKDTARVAVCGAANTARTSGREARSRRRASRDQKGCTATFEGAIGARIGRHGLIDPGSSAFADSCGVTSRSRQQRVCALRFTSSNYTSPDASDQVISVRLCVYRLVLQ